MRSQSECRAERGPGWEPDEEPPKEMLKEQRWDKRRHEAGNEAGPVLFLGRVRGKLRKHH